MELYGSERYSDEPVDDEEDENGEVVGAEFWWDIVGVRDACDDGVVVDDDNDDDDVWMISIEWCLWHFNQKWLAI